MIWVIKWLTVGETRFAASSLYFCFSLTLNTEHWTKSFLFFLFFIYNTKHNPDPQVTIFLINVFIWYILAFTSKGIKTDQIIKISLKKNKFPLFLVDNYIGIVCGPVWMLPSAFSPNCSDTRNVTQQAPSWLRKNRTTYAAHNKKKKNQRRAKLDESLCLPSRWWFTSESEFSWWSYQLWRLSNQMSYSDQDSVI